MARGSVTRYGDGWAIRYDSGIDSLTGKRWQPFESGFATRQEAEARLAQCLATVASGQHTRPDKRTFADYSRYWLDAVMVGAVRDNSHYRYQTTITEHLIPAFGTLKLNAITAPLVQALYRRKDRAGLSARTITGIHARLHQILSCAVREQLLSTNIMEQVTPPKPEQPEMRVWSAAELDRFLRHSAGHFLAPLWHLYAMTGMRRGEGLGLRWRDVDWAGRQLHIRQQVQRIDHQLCLVPLKTEASRRSISIGDGTAALLTAHRAAQNEIRLRRGTAWRDHGLVFAYTRPRDRGERVPGGPWGPDVITGMWHTLLAHTDLPYIRLHDLRHTHATLLLRADGNVKVIAQRLGHDPAMLLRIYAHAHAADQERAVARLDALLCASRPVPEMIGEG